MKTETMTLVALRDLDGTTRTSVSDSGLPEDVYDWIELYSGHGDVASKYPSGTVFEVATVYEIPGPPKFIAMIPTERDDAGNVVNYKLDIFDRYDAAAAAVDHALAARRA